MSKAYTQKRPTARLYDVTVKEVVETRLLKGLIKLTTTEKTRSLGKELHIKVDADVTRVFINGKRVRV